MGYDMRQRIDIYYYQGKFIKERTGNVRQWNIDKILFLPSSMQEKARNEQEQECNSD